MDLGASQHIASALKYFSSIEKIFPVTVHLLENTSVAATTQGKVTLNLNGFPKGKKWTTCVIIT